MDQDDKITVKDALAFFQGEVWSAEQWLLNFSTGRNKRGDLDISQHIQKLNYRRWVVEQLRKSIK